MLWKTYALSLNFLRSSILKLPASIEQIGGRTVYILVVIQTKRQTSANNHFWVTVCKTVRPMLSDRCLSVLSVYGVGVLWPNCWMDQDAT